MQMLVKIFTEKIMVNLYFSIWIIDAISKVGVAVKSKQLMMSSYPLYDRYFMTIIQFKLSLYVWNAIIN
jgi:hypothetical protein